MSSLQPIAPNPVITLQGVTKTYAIWDDPSARLMAPLRRLWPGSKGKAEARLFTAVRDITLEVAPGECLGIIGRNGAGKSTLLQMIAGTVRPTAGSVKVNGRVAALLELGSGFNPDFTGRENIHLNAAILGLSKTEIAAKYDAIVTYSGIEEFIDQPVRTYSSGMTLRLAFAVCVHVDADILIIDEALAVGDARFQFKCHATLDQMLTEGRTIIFVSHDTNAIKRMCQSALLLERGEALLKGSPNDVTNIYTKLITSPHGVEAIRAELQELSEQRAKGEGRADTPLFPSGNPVCPVDACWNPRDRPPASAGAIVPGSRQGETRAKETGDGGQRTENEGQGGDQKPEVRGQGSGDTPTLGEEPRAKGHGTDPQLPTSNPQLSTSNAQPSALISQPAAQLVAEERAHQQISDKEYSYGGELGRISAVELTDDQGQPRLSFLTGSQIRVRITCEAQQDILEPIYALTLKDIRGQEIYGTNTYFQNQTPPTVPAGAKVEASFALQLNVLPGVYFISLGWVRLVNCEVQVIHRRYDVLRLDVLPRDKSFGLAWCPTLIEVVSL